MSGRNRQDTGHYEKGVVGADRENMQGKEAPRRGTREVNALGTF